MSQQQEPPKIEFPCPDYPIKAVGINDDDFRQHVIDIIKQHVPDFDESTVSLQDSSKGRFQSVRFRITAQSVEQLNALHQGLMAPGRVKMVI